MFSRMGIDLEGHDNIARKGMTTNRDDVGMPGITLGKKGHTGGATAQINQHHAAFAFFSGQHPFGSGEGLEYHFVDFHTSFLEYFNQALDSKHFANDNMHIDFEAEAMHTNRLEGKASAWAVSMARMISSRVTTPSPTREIADKPVRL